MFQAEERMKHWLDQEDLDKVLKEELLKITDREEIEDRFYRDLEFGTGGLRGILGAGTNRMNIYTVRKATQGFADYLNRHYGPESGKNPAVLPAVAIAYDSRINSRLFAGESARVLAANGIKSYLYTELMPTPALSFAVRHFKCCAGIMVTASHNPSKYNGYKVYNEEGCQLTLEAADEVLSCIQKVDLFNDVKTEAEDPNLIEHISEEAMETYLAAVLRESTGVDCSGLSVVFTPLNGTGNVPVRRIMERIGVKQVNIVQEQELPDGNFPTCPYPNPEKKEALGLGLELCRRLAQEGKAPDILLATDPDCDRVGIAVRHSQSNGQPNSQSNGQPNSQSNGQPNNQSNGQPNNQSNGQPNNQSNGQPNSQSNGQPNSQSNEEYQLITGNEAGILLLDYLCTVRGEAERDGTAAGAKPLPRNPVAIKTIVTSKMAEQVAKAYDVAMIDVLTGFKFIGEQIGLLEAKGEEDRYIFGFEESYGYLAGTYVRDKDAVNASMLICEMTAYYKKAGKTLVDRLNELYERYGYYKNDLMEFTFEGAAGMEKMNEIMKGLRADPPAALIGRKVVEIADYRLSQRRILGNSKTCDLAAGTKPIRLPKSDVLEYVLEDGSSFVVRPSGTEPKLKIYLSAKGGSRKESEEIIEKLKAELEEIKQ